MCFENLPIEFDSAGNAHLKSGVPNPYQFQIKTPEEKEEQLREIARKNGQLFDKDLYIPTKDGFHLITLN